MDTFFQKPSPVPGIRPQRCTTLLCPHAWHRRLFAHRHQKQKSPKVGRSKASHKKIDADAESSYGLAFSSFQLRYFIFRICCSSCFCAVGISSHREATSLILAIDIGRRTILAFSTSALNSLSL